MANIKNNNYRKIDCRLIKDEYIDFMLSKDEVIDNKYLLETCLAAKLKFQLRYTYHSLLRLNLLRRRSPRLNFCFFVAFCRNWKILPFLRC